MSERWPTEIRLSGDKRVLTVAQLGKVIDIED